MNVQSIWAGEEYAFVHYRPKQTFITNATKGKAIKVEKEKTYGKERATAYVLMEITTDMGNVRTEKVRVRDVIDFWDSYERERNALVAEREERDRIAREQRERMQAEREERLKTEREVAQARIEQEQSKSKQLVDALIARTSMPAEVVQTVGAITVSLDRHRLELWLSTPDNRGMSSTLQPLENVRGVDEYRKILDG